MKEYQEKAGESIIRAYHIVDDGITLEYKDGSRYLYNYKKNSRKHIETMKELAKLGAGLSSYVQKHIGDDFAEKLK